VGSAAPEPETYKKAKYQALALSNTFVPTAVETLGTWGEGALSLVAELGKRISCVSGDLRSAAFFVLFTLEKMFCIFLVDINSNNIVAPHGD